MFVYKRSNLFAFLVLSLVIATLASAVPQVRASIGLSLDGTGSACTTSNSNSVSIQTSTCSTINSLCATHSGGFCPEGDLVILQILLNNTGTVTSVLGNQGLSSWFRRASVLNGQGGRMEEWYSMTTRTVSNPSIYITETLSKITVAVQEFAIAGYDPNTPFDSNPGVPANITGVSNVMAAAISTNDAQDMLLGFAYGGSGAISAEAGFSGTCLNVSPCVFMGIGADASEYEIVTMTQSHSIVAMTQAGALSWGFIADAVQSVSPSVIFVSPSKGIVGTGITITGTSLTGTLFVTFCATLQLAFIVVNDTTITTTAPQVASPPNSQSCDVVVTKSGGISVTSLTDRFSFLPSVKSVSPPSGGNGVIATVTGTGFVGTATLSLCGVSQPRFTVTNDTQIIWTVSDIGVTASKPCDLVITNSVGRSSTSTSDAFTYAPQGGGATNHAPNAPTNSNKILYITAAGIAAVSLFAVAGLMRQHDPEKKDELQFQAKEESVTNSFPPASQAEISIKYHVCR